MSDPCYNKIKTDLNLEIETRKQIMFTVFKSLERVNNRITTVIGSDNDSITTGSVTTAGAVIAGSVTTGSVTTGSVTTTGAVTAGSLTTGSFSTGRISSI